MSLFASSILLLIFLAQTSGGQNQPTGPAPVPFTVPESVKAERDVAYAGNQNPRQTLDLFLPRTPKSDKPLPVIVAIHGGGWQNGDKSQTQGVSKYAASGFYAGVSVGYRLSAEATWPAQIYDCKAAIRWVRANASKYHLDPDRIGVVGGSAGGHLASMLGTTARVDGLEGDLGPYKGTTTKVRCVVDQFGPSDLPAIGDYPSQVNHNGPYSPEARLLGCAIPDHKDAARAASPITYVSRDDPPFLIMHGDKDPTVPFNQSERFVKALRAAGVETLFFRVEGGAHGRFRNPEVSNRIRQFFDKHLLDRRVTVSELPVLESSPPAKSGATEKAPR